MKTKRYFAGSKAQLTLFFIIGLMLIAAFAFMAYLNARTAEQQLQAPTDKLIADILKTGAVPFYVGLCLDNVSKSGLVMAGKQGGNIYRYQDGPAPDPTMYIGLGEKVSYGISQPFLVNKTDYPEPPGYPGGKDSVKQVPALDFTRPGRFGEVTLQRLCDSFGANSVFSEYVFGRDLGGITHVFCQAPYIYGDVLSTQWQLEQFIAKTIVNCTDWEAINEETGYNITRQGDVNVTFRLGLNDIYIDAYIPLEIKVGGYEPVYTIGDFHTRLPVRLKTIVEYASHLATYDSYMLNFNMSKNYKYPAQWDTNIEVKITTPMKMLGVWEDIITIEDSASVIDGENFVYQFVRANRIPALDLMTQTNNYSEYDFMVMEGDTIFLNPNPPNITFPDGTVDTVIYDPDEDNLTYYYTGWKSTCDELFNFDTGKPNTLCSEMEPTHPSQYFVFPNRGAQVDNLKWNPSNWRAGLAVAAMSTEIYPELAPLNWTTSENYLASGRNATYRPNHDDIGPHNVTVWVCDEAGLCDYQIVRILVIDYPELHLNGTNPYAKFDENIPHDAASVEDFYMLSADGSTGYVVFELGLVEGYMFLDVLEPFNLTVVPPVLVVDIPIPPPSNSRDIRYIHEYNFSRDTLLSLGAGTSFFNHIIHEINLTVPRIPVIPKTMNVSVYQCIPFRNPDYTSPMWPYNETNAAGEQMSPYIASHTCCSLGGQYNNTLIVEPVLGDSNSYTIVNQYGVDISRVKVYLDTGAVRSCPAFDVTEFPYECEFATDNFNVTLEQDMITIESKPSLIPYDAFNITVEQISADPTIRPWGSWEPATKPCYGGIPKYGVLSYFEIGDVTPEPGVISAPVVTYEGVTASHAGSGYSVPDSWRNDVVMMFFARYCSGSRGNICNGHAEAHFERLDYCEDMDWSLEGGEIESCVGPHTDLIQSTDPWVTSKTMTPMISATTCTEHTDCGTGKCIEGNCYRWSVTDMGCSKGYSGTTFEKEFGLNRTKEPDQVANGTCNPYRTCGDEFYDYGLDSTHDTGEWLIRGATCKLGGTCSQGIEASATKCTDYNGQVSVEDTQKYCNIDPSKEHFYTSVFQCESRGTMPSRTADCFRDTSPDLVDADPDKSPFACTACSILSDAAQHPNGEWNNGKCCGDDIVEGGFLYGISGLKIARSTINNPAKGTYDDTELVCDDYVDLNSDGNYDAGEGINNDCESGANCADPDCRENNDEFIRWRELGYETWKAKLGPDGSMCCSIPGHCKNFLDPDAADSSGVLCGDNDECDCIPVGIGTAGSPRIHGTVRRGETVRTCVPSQGELFHFAGEDRKFEILGGGIPVVAGVTNVGVIDTSCNIESVDIFIDGRFFYFSNSAPKDCLVEVRIT